MSLQCATECQHDAVRNIVKMALLYVECLVKLHANDSVSISTMTFESQTFLSLATTGLPQGNPSLASQKHARPISGKRSGRIRQGEGKEKREGEWEEGRG